MADKSLPPELVAALASIAPRPYVPVVLPPSDVPALLDQRRKEADAIDAAGKDLAAWAERHRKAPRADVVSMLEGEADRWRKVKP